MGTRRDIEHWLTRRGIPHFIDHYSASRDVLTRAIPFLTAVFLIQVFGAAETAWPWWANTLAVAGGFAFLLGAWAVINRIRRRPLLARPERIGWVEMTVFVLVPALLPLVFGGGAEEALATAAINLLILALVYLVTSYGLVPMARWAFVQVFRQLGGTFALFTQGLPLLLLAFLFLFINAEVWQVASSLTDASLAAVLGLFLMLGVLFIVTRLPREIAPLARFSGSAEIERLIRDTPAEGLPAPEPSSPGEITGRQWGNVGLVVLVTQALRVTIAAAMIGLFFVVFGVLTMHPETVQTWTTTAPNVLVTFPLFGNDLSITEELLRVAVFLAGFSGFYFTIYVVTDPTFRESFFEDIADEIRQAFAVRATYAALDDDSR